jgi:hypothetical protein
VSRFAADVHRITDTPARGHADAEQVVGDAGRAAGGEPAG